MYYILELCYMFLDCSVSVLFCLGLAAYLKHLCMICMNLSRNFDHEVRSRGGKPQVVTAQMGYHKSTKGEKYKSLFLLFLILYFFVVALWFIIELRGMF